MEIIRNNYDSMYKFFIEFCKIKSVVGTQGEKQAANFLYENISQLEYFKENPDDIWLEPVIHDPMHRENFVGLIRSKKNVKKTIILIGHIDVVSSDVCGELSELAFDPERYTKALKSYILPHDAKKDLQDSGWIFGRGTADMKSGLTALIGYFSEMSSMAEELDANILLFGLADEENNGFGIHQAVYTLNKLKELHELDYVVCIDAEPTIASDNKDMGRVYLGTIGCATPFALCIGKESHVGEYFEGVNGALIASHLNILAEGDLETSDEWNSIRYSPQTCLKMQELRIGYSVTLPERVIVCYNVLMIQRTPTQILEYFERVAHVALARAVGQVKAKRDKLYELGAFTLPEIDYKYRVMYYSELLDLVEKFTGKKHTDIASEILATLDPNADSQDRGIALINRFTDLAGVEGIVVIVGFLSPYCQSRVNDRQTKYELAVVSSVDKLVENYEKTYNEKLIVSEIFEGISDMSELGFQESGVELDFLTSNLVGYKTDINNPFEEMMKLDIPVINLGPVGKDAHQMTERVYLPFAFDVLPKQIKFFIDAFLEEIK